jgi:hypothetical protein
MVNTIGGSSLSAAVASEKSIEPKKIHLSRQETGRDQADDTDIEAGSDSSLSASVAAFLSLPGFDPAAGLQADSAAQSKQREAADPVKALLGAPDDGLKLALQQFDDGLKKLADRPETQIFQARFGMGQDANTALPGPEPLPGVNDKGQLDVGQGDQAADVNHDGKVSDDERRRYTMPITYRSSERPADAAADGPSAFSLAEAHRAYGAVATVATA